MAIQGQVGKENQDISFRLRSKSQIFDGSSNVLFNAKCDIAASSSPLGIVFVGSSNPELIVVCLKDLENPTAEEQIAPVRKTPLPSPTTQIAVNCDGSLLAVAVKLNGTPHIQIYSVASFLTPNIQKIREFRLSADNADALQICWNPVMNTTLAICTESGGLNTYNLKDTGIEFHSLDPNLRANSCCWSPKGKQLVAGFANGRLMQFTPEMKAAKSIECPPGIMSGNFETIAIQWLSTFQFAVAFSGIEANARPVLHIVNAPKAGPPQFIAYNDVCYSSTEQRPSRIYLRHIMSWNLLLVASANSIDVSFLRISQPGDLPQWTQEFPNDMYPAELPLTPSKDESFPLGFELDTGTTGHLLVEDGSPLPVMPMIHIISSAGVLCSFYVLNTTQGTPGICSPARPIDQNALSLFRRDQPQESVKTPPKTFIPPIGQSTPAPKVQPVPALPPFQMPVQAPTAQPPQLKLPGFGVPPTTQQQAPVISAFQSQPQPQPAPISKPPQALITVTPTFTPATKKSDLPSTTTTSAEKTLNTAEDEQIYSKMIQDEVKAFELEMRTVMERSRSLRVNIGTKEESAAMRRGIEELDELKKEAMETVDSMRSDVQSSRLGLTEMFAMVYEANSKITEKSSFMSQNQVQDRTTRRTLDRLFKQISQCEMQLQSAVQVMNGQWSNYLEAIHKSRKNRMHNPSLEGLYQTLTKQQEIIYRQHEKMTLLKTKLGLKDQISKHKASLHPSNESFSDQMISVSLADQIQVENAKLTNKKLKNLRNLISNRDVVKIKPQRPERPGLNSEIIREKKLQVIKTMRKPQPVQAAAAPTSSFPNIAHGQAKTAPQKRAPSFDLHQQAFAAAPQTSFGFESSKPTTETSNITATGQKTTAFSNTNILKKTDEPGFGGLFGSSPNWPAPTASEPSKSATDSMIANILKKADDPAHGGKFGLSSNWGAVTTSEPSKTQTAGISFGASGNLTTAHAFTANSSAFGNSAATVFRGPSTTPQSFGTASKTPVSVFGAPPSDDLHFDSSSPDKKSLSFTSPAMVAAAVQPKPLKTSEPLKPPPATVAVSATFSIPLAHKVPSTAHKDPSKAVEKKPEESKAESASFTFKIPEKSTDSSVVTIKASAGTPNFAALLGDNPKGFAFGKPAATIAPATTGSNISAVGGSANAPFSGFGSGFSLNLGGEAEKPASSTFSFSLPTTGSSTKTTSSFAFGGDAKPPASTSGVLDLTTSPVSATKATPKSVFGAVGTPESSVSPLNSSTTAIGAATTSFGAPPTNFSFVSSLSQISSKEAEATSVSSTISEPAQSATISPVVTTSINADPLTPSPEATLQSLKFCSPDTKPSTTTSASPFGATSAFGGSTFGAVSATTQASPSIFAAQSPAVTTQASVFSTAASTTATPSLFGSLSLTTSESNKTPTSPPSGLFSSLVKPDQSVFTSPSPTSPFGGGSVFGAAPASTAPTSPFGANAGSVFSSAPTQSNIFGQQQQQPSSVFGQQGAAPAAGGGLFSQSTFSTTATTAASNVFGGGQAQTTSPFGGTSVFGGASQSPFGGTSAFGSGATGGSVFGGTGAPSTNSSFGGSSVFGGNSNSSSTFSNAFGGGGVGQSGFGSTGGGGSVFNQAAPAFGSNPTFGGTATFGSPKQNIFGQATTSPGQSNSLFEQLGSQQGGGNLFGSIAQNTSQPPPQQPQQSGGFSGSAFSSWR